MQIRICLSPRFHKTPSCNGLLKPEGKHMGIHCQVGFHGLWPKVTDFAKTEINPLVSFLSSSGSMMNGGIK